MLSEAASERLQMKLDAQIQASQSELVRLEEIKRLQADSDSLKAQLNDVIEKYNGLVVRHIQHKARRKSQVKYTTIYNKFSTFIINLNNLHRKKEKNCVQHKFLFPCIVLIVQCPYMCVRCWFDNVHKSFNCGKIGSVVFRVHSVFV